MTKNDKNTVKKRRTDRYKWQKHEKNNMTGKSQRNDDKRSKMTRWQENDKTMTKQK